jgi:hypothetical protein
MLYLHYMRKNIVTESLYFFFIIFLESIFIKFIKSITDENILIDDSDNPILGSLRLSLKMDSKDALNFSAAGNLAFMSPEVLIIYKL